MWGKKKRVDLYLPVVPNRGLCCGVQEGAYELEMAVDDLRVKAVQSGEDLDCDISQINHSNVTDVADVTCVIQSSSDAEITAVKVPTSPTSRLHPKPFHSAFYMRTADFYFFFLPFYSCPLIGLHNDGLKVRNLIFRFFHVTCPAFSCV